jgi:SHS2 domain-containing protein
VKKDFEAIEHTADIGIAAYGTDLKQVFANAALGLFSLITELDTVSEKNIYHIQVKAPDRDALLVNWLNELIYRFEAKEMLFHRFTISTLTDTELKATGYGEKIDLAKHELKIQVKAATYHMLKIEQNKDEWRAQVIFDV